MPRTSQQFKKMKENRIDSILEAALVLYALYGDKITIDAIAERAKCSHGILYHYFSNVDEIIAKLLSSHKYNDLKNKLVHEYKGILAKDSIKFIAETLLNLKTIEEVCYGNILINNNDKKSLRDCLLKLIEKGQKEGDITGGDPYDIANVFFFTLKGIYLNSLLRRNPDPYRPSLDNIMEIFRKRIN